MNRIGYVCFGEVNTPFSRIELKHDHALKELQKLDGEIVDAGIVIDDPEYKTADKAIAKLSGEEFSSLIVCIAGWVPSHAVIRVTDAFRHMPMVLWGLCGWVENGKIITTAEQAGTTALRAVFEEMDYRFKYVYSVINEDEPIEKIRTFTTAAFAAKQLRYSRVGTMGYRDMLLYGTQFEGNSLRNQIGVEVEPFEMLEMVQNLEDLDEKEIKKGVQYIRENWEFQQECEDAVLETGVKYALAIGKKIKERKFGAISLIDVDGMKKLLKFPPAMVFVLLEHYYGVLTIPENDILGAVTQLIMKYISGQTIPYMEFYEFFEKSMLIGVPDYIPEAITDGKVKVLPTSFGLLAKSIVVVSKPKPGYITCARLIQKKGKYYLHAFTANAKESMPWEEFGWEPPAPQLPSLEIFPDSCTVEEFAHKVASQHIIFAYGDHMESLKDFCQLTGIEMI